MAINYGYFDSTTDDPRLYNADTWAMQQRLFNGNGICAPDRAGDMRVAAAGRELSVREGTAIINGYFCRIVGSEELAVGTETGKARVMLRLDLSPEERSIKPVLVRGDTEKYPELVREGVIYDLCLCNVDITGTGVSVTDTRWDPALCGYSVVNSNIDGEYFDTLSDTAIHNIAAAAHANILIDGAVLQVIDGNITALEEHSTDENAHQNLQIDGNNV